MQRFEDLMLDKDITIHNYKQIEAMCEGKVPEEGRYALYDDLRWQERWTLILEDGSVYLFGVDTGVKRIDGELNHKVPYTHLGRKITTKDLVGSKISKLDIEYVEQLITFSCFTEENLTDSPIKSNLKK